MKLLRMVLPVVIALCTILPVSAQEPTGGAQPPVVIEEGDTVVVDTTEPPNIPYEDEAASLAEILLAAVGASALGTAPVTMFLVSLLKRLFINASARVLTTITALVLAALTAVAVYLGFGVQWNSLLDTVGTVGPTIVIFVTTLIGAPGWYELARTVNAPIAGYQRTPQNHPRFNM